MLANIEGKVLEYLGFIQSEKHFLWWICQKLYSIAYRGEYKNRLKFLCLLEFQFHNTLRLLLLSINYIQLQRKSNNTQGLTIKTKWILGLKLGQIQEHIVMTFA